MPILKFIREHIWFGIPAPAAVTFRMRAIAAPAWGGFLVLLGLVLAWRGWRRGEPFLGGTLRNWAFAGLILAVLLLIPRVGPHCYALVLRAFGLLGFVLSNLLMIIFFYVFVTPLAWGMRLTGHDPLEMRRPARPAWHTHCGKTDRKRYYRMF